MTLEVSCPQCSATVDLSTARQGSLVTCGSCGLKMTVGIIVTPTAAAAGTPSAAPAQPGAPQPTAPADTSALAQAAAGRTQAPSRDHTSGAREFRKLLREPTDLKVNNIEATCTTLAEWLDVKPSTIRECHEALERNDAYQVWRIPKGNSGKFREISSPTDALKHVQRRILDRLLYRIPVSNATHGFIPGRSIVTGAKVHLDFATEIVNIDLQDAFPSVSAERVRHLFVRHIKIPFLHLGRQASYDHTRDLMHMLTRLVTWNGKLPQGGPTSGYLLNVACITLDKRIFRLLDELPGTYRFTRYADDITISASNEIPKIVRQAVMKVITNCGFRANPEKVKYLRRDAGQMLEVTGLYVEKGRVRIPREKLDRYRAKIHQAAKIDKGSLTDELRLDVQSTAAFVGMVYGKLPHKIAKPYFEFLEAHGLKKPWEVRGGVTIDMYPDDDD